ncbi:MAG: FadR family transcriptional regulator [Anaerolineae bacterium]|nr:FadR family transcriptional regulator [Anaerolineae bacterium]
MLKPVSRDTLTLQAAETLKRFIIEENLATGTQLPSERELSETLAVSRNIIREALSALVAEGIVVKQAGRGTFVADFDRGEVPTSTSFTLDSNPIDLRDLREARAAMELGMVALMVQRVTPEEIEALREIVRQHELRQEEGRSTIREDINFHLMLLKITKNAVLEELAPLVREVFRRTLVEAPSSILNNPERVIREHQKIISALEQKNGEEVREALHAHYHLEDFPR